MRRVLLCAALMMAATPAFADGICIVDLQKAVADTNEGKSAQKKLDSMFSSRKAQLAKMEADLRKAAEDYQARSSILTDAARKDQETQLMQQQQQLSQAAAQAEQEMQQNYVSMLGDLDTKLRTITASVGTSNGCSVVLDKAAVVYAGSDVRDITGPLVSQYNRQYPGQ